MSSPNEESDGAGPFEFATANRILFGNGTVRRAGEIARAWRTRALLLTGSNPRRAAALFETLEECQVEYEIFSIDSEPTVDQVREGLERARASGCRAVIACGGGSGGMALSNAGLGVVHAFASPLGGKFPAPHGAICAALLPHAMNENIRALRKRSPRNPALEQYGEIASRLTGERHSKPEAGAAWVESLCRELKVAGLKDYGVGSAHVEELVEKAFQTNSMKGNPIELRREEAARILEAAMVG